MLSACVLWAIVVERTGIFGVLLRSRPLVYIGMISYGIYLYHPIAGYLFENPILRPIVTVMAAGLSWSAIERPILRLKRYFPNSPQPR
jgi:peptidoglycan/LPS O-acetylase OafA/YrhL